MVVAVVDSGKMDQDPMLRSMVLRVVLYLRRQLSQAARLTIPTWRQAYGATKRSFMEKTVLMMMAMGL